jgi:FkbM family methyltransferase
MSTISVSGMAQRIAARSLRLLGPRQRAQVLERATDSMVTTAEIPGGSIRFFTPASSLFWRAESVLTKEVDTIRWIDDFRPDDVFWDVGANVGVYSLYAASHNRVTVLSFEPSAANYYVLTKNIQLNELGSHITAYCLAFAAQTQLGVLNIQSNAMGSALSQFGGVGDRSLYWRTDARPAFHGMLGYSIDEFIRCFSPPFPNHLKLDVDGLEIQILEGAQNTLRDARLRSVLVELNLGADGDEAATMRILADAGLRPVAKGDVQKSDLGQTANFVFARPNDQSSQPRADR